MHIGDVLHKRNAHVFFDFKYTIELVTALNWGWNQLVYFVTIKGRAHIVVMFVNFVVVKVEGFKFGKITKFQFLKVKL